VRYSDGKRNPSNFQYFSAMTFLMQADHVAKAEGCLTGSPFFCQVAVAHIGEVYGTNYPLPFADPGLPRPLE
jgi:hypothetical protein